MRWQWQNKHRRDGVALEEYSGFGVPVLSDYMETSKEEEMDSAIEAAPLAVGTGVVEADRLNAKHPGVFMEVLKDRQRFKEL